MTEPNFHRDGWELEDAEKLHREYPDTFEVPPRDIRGSLEPGDYAKLIFRIAVENEGRPEAFERMWVIVRELTRDSYFGVLDNEPGEIVENEELWLGTELPFQARHIIDVQPGDKDSMALAAVPPRRPWPRGQMQ